MNTQAIRKKPLIVAILVLMFITAVAMAYTVVRIPVFLFIGVSGKNQSVDEANEFQWPGLTLPASASDVSYYTDHYWSEAEFAINEEEFLKWCESAGWKVEKIAKPVTYFEPLMMGHDLRPVSNGYIFYPPEGSGVFDADRSRANFNVSIFP